MSIKHGKYRTPDGLVAKVLFVGDRSVFYRTADGFECSVSKEYAEAYWSEYKEPRTITFFVNIYEQDGGLRTGVVWPTREKALAAGLEVIDTMEITWTEKFDG